jgi:hypothetical protein
MTTGSVFAKDDPDRTLRASEFPVTPHSASLLPSLFSPANSLFAPAGKFLPEMIEFSACFGTKKAPVRRLSWIFPVFFPVRRESAFLG